MSSFSHPAIVVEDETSLEPVRFTLKWSIQHFEGLRNRNDCMYSTGITMAELGMEDSYRGRWRVCAKPCHTQHEVNYVSVFLWLTDEDLKSTAYTGQRALSLLCKERITTGKLMDVAIYADKAFTGLLTFPFDENAKCRDNRVITHKDLLGSGEKAGCLKDSCLNITMDVILYREPKTTRMSELVFPRLLQRYQEFLGRQLKWREADGDLLLVSNDSKEFRVHRCLLMAQSPVFAAMLSHNSKEKQTARCELADVDGECVEILLEYVYGCGTGKVQGNNAEKVLIMADKCQMMDLRAVCELMLANNIAVDNAVQIFAMARQRNLASLKDAAMKIIRKNMDLEMILDESIGL